MKIAMIGHKRVPSREGGVEIVVEELATRLVKNGHQVDVYNRKGKNVQDKNVDKENRKLREYKGIRLIAIPTINKKGIDALLYSFFATIRALFGRYDVIHYHAEGPCAMLWIPHLFGIKTVATIHGLDWQRSKWGGFATKYIKFGEKIAARYADEIIVLSKNVQKYFKETYNRDTNFIPNGVNKPEMKEVNVIKEKWGLEKDNYILFLARIVPEKGLHYLIDAYKQIDTDKKLVIAGGASHTNDYLEKIKEKVKDNNRIIMTGFVQGQELEELYSNCYLYCLPSDVEGMPISLLEAMSYGCNCLVSNIEENTQVTEKYATRFEKGNVLDLKENLENILKVDKRLGKERISNYVTENYNWEDSVNKTEGVYEIKEKKCKKITTKIQNLLFYVGILFLGLEFWLSSTSIGFDTKILYGVSIIAFIFSINVKKYMNPKDSIKVLLLIILSVLSYYHTKSFTVAKTSLVLLNLKDRDIDGTLKVMMFTAIFACIITNISAICFDKGVLFLEKNYGRGVIEKRYCLGFSQPNNLHLIFAYIVACFIYFRFGRIKLRDLTLLSIVNVILFLMTRSRTGIALTFVILIASYVIQRTNLLNKKNAKRIIQIIYIMIIAMSIWITVMYGKINIINEVDSVLTGRIKFANRYFEQYPINLFGNNIIIKAAFDLGIVSVLLKYGLITYLLVIVRNIYSD